MFGAFADVPLQYLLLKGAPVIQDHEPQPLNPPVGDELIGLLQQSLAQPLMYIPEGEYIPTTIAGPREDEPEYEVVITFLDETHVHADSVEVEGKWVHVYFDDGGEILWNTDFVDIISMAWVPVGDVHRLDPGDVCLDKLAEMEEDLERDDEGRGPGDRPEDRTTANPDWDGYGSEGDEEPGTGGADLDISSFRKNN